jgi:hypothetical protein
MAASQRTGSLGRRERVRVARDFDRALGARTRAGGHRLPSSNAGSFGLEAWKRAGAVEKDPRAPRSKSSVLDDAREVAARRKRQLGRDRP